MTKVLMLDYDGVIFTNKNMLSRVSLRAASYVRKKINNTWTPSQAVRMNELLYKNYGHTWTGLNQLYYNSNKHHQSLHDFNRYVYDSSLIKQARVSSNAPLQTLQFHEIQNRCKELKIPLYILTNSPRSWVLALNYAMEIEIPPSHIISCDHEVLGNRILKPDMSFYGLATMHIKSQERIWNNDVQFIMVDDSFCNLVPLMNKKEFWPILYSTDPNVDMAKTMLGHASQLPDIIEIVENWT